MDTKPEYRNTILAVRLADGRHDSVENRAVNIPDRGLGGVGNDFVSAADDTVPVDGWVTFYWPDRPTDEPYMAYSFPFRSVEKDGARWLADPDADQWSRRPIWKWTNPDEPLSELTLEPSIGVRGEHGVVFHCWVENGEVEWL